MTPRLPDALVLTAGLGTRLRPLTLVRAKPACPVAGVPLICRVLTWLASRGVCRAVLNLHARPETLTREVGHGESLGLTVRYSWEPVLLGSAGGPRRALPLLATDPFLVVNGDTLTDLDLDGLVAAHHNSSALVTMAVIPNEAPHRYGGVLVADDGAIVGFTQAGDPRPSFHFPGVQVASHSAFADLPVDEPAESVTGRYRALMIARPGSVRAFVTTGAFDDIGTAAGYLRASQAIAAREGRGSEALRGRRVNVSAGARVTGSVLWDDIDVPPGCRLVDCIVADGVRLPSGFDAERTIVIRARDVPDVQDGSRVDDLFLCPVDAAAT